MVSLKASLSSSRVSVAGLLPAMAAVRSSWGREIRELHSRKDRTSCVKLANIGQLYGSICWIATLVNALEHFWQTCTGNLYWNISNPKYKALKAPRSPANPDLGLSLLTRYHFKGHSHCSLGRLQVALTRFSSARPALRFGLLTPAQQVHQPYMQPTAGRGGGEANSIGGDDCCWICLSQSELGNVLELPCACPRPVHLRCLAR